MPRTYYPTPSRHARAKGPAPPTPRPRPPPHMIPSATGLSVVAAFDDLTRNAKVLSAGCETEFISFVRQSHQWIKRWKEAEIQREQLQELIKEKEKELMGKDMKIKQAQRLVMSEQKGRQLAESERDELAEQLEKLKEILLSNNDVRRGVDNETLEKIRSIDTTTRKFSPFKEPHHRPLAKVDESVESLLDVSELSFDETRDDLGESRLFNQQPANPQLANRYEICIFDYEYLIFNIFRFLS